MKGWILPRLLCVLPLNLAAMDAVPATRTGKAKRTAAKAKRVKAP